MVRSGAITASIDELWLRTQQKLTSHIAHDLKGALNGVSVNIEVVKSRAERGEAPITDVQRYATAGADQLGAVIRMTSALLSLARSGRGVTEVAVIARQLGNLLEDTLRSDGAGMEIQVEGGLSAATSAPASAVRLALAEPLLAAAIAKSETVVRVRALPRPSAEIRTTAGVSVGEDTITVLATVGIEFSMDGHGISIIFPGPSETLTEDA